MKMRILKWVSFLMLLTLTACHTSKTATEGGESVPSKNEQASLQKIKRNNQRAACITAKVELEINAMGKDVTVGGRLRMRRDDAILVSLTMLGFEVGRLEFRPENVTIVDRVNKQFVRAGYGDVGFLRQANLDFYSLQSLFWNEIFVPGVHGEALPYSRLSYEEGGEHAIFSVTDAPKLDYIFVTQQDRGLLNRVTVKEKNKNTGAQFNWTYDYFVQLDQRLFPALMKCQVTGLDKELGFSMTLTRMDNEEGWSSETKLSSRYKERQVEDIFKQLMAL